MNSKVVRTVLDNGLVIVTQEKHDAPVVTMQAWVHVGSADEPEHLAGIAHLHEHMLFKGTAKRGVGEIARTVEASGGEINAWTSFDQTVYHIVLGASECNTGLDILSDALMHSAFAAEELKQEIEVVLEEINRAEDTPTRRLSKAVFELAYPTHPYGSPVLGTKQTVAAMTQKQIIEFYKTYYRPNNTTLVIVGDFDTPVLIDQAKSFFGDWCSNHATAPVRDSVPFCQSPKAKPRQQILTEDVKTTRMGMAWAIPSITHSDIPAIEAMSVILGHGESSRLYGRLRRGRELFTDIYAFAYTPTDPGLLMIGGGLKAGHLETCIRALCDEIAEFRDIGVTHDELEAARVLILSEAAYQMETVQGLARKLGYYEVNAGDHRFEIQYRQCIKALTTEDISDVASRYLHGAPSVVLQTSPSDPWPADVSLGNILGKRYRQRQSRTHVQPAKDGVTRVTLDNGSILLMRQEESPIVALRAVALGGKRYETPANAGIGLAFGSVWGSATQALSQQSFATRIAMLGGSLSAFSGRNALGLRGEFLSEKVTEGTGLFCDALLESAVTDADVKRECKTLLQRMKSRGDNPGAIAYDAFTAALYPNHPYGLPPLGTEATVDAFSKESILNHGCRMLAPHRMVVAVCGRINPNWVADTFAAKLVKQSNEHVPTLKVDAIPTQGDIRITADKKQAHIIVGTMGLTIHDEQRYALDVLTTILSGQSGRLFLDLRDKRGLAYSVSCSSSEGIDPGHVMVHMGTSPDKVGEALEGIYGHLQRITEEKVSTSELARATRYLIGTHAIDLQRCGARAMTMALDELFGLGYDNDTRYTQHIEAVTAENILHVAQQFFNRDRLLQVVVGP